jgi:Heavy metal associated domain 2
MRAFAYADRDVESSLAFQATSAGLDPGSSRSRSNPARHADGGTWLEPPTPSYTRPTFERRRLRAVGRESRQILRAYRTARSDSSRMPRLVEPALHRNDAHLSQSCKYRRPIMAAGAVRSFRYMIQLVHDVPGRLRFRVASLKGDHRRAATLRHQVRALGGVTMASFNAVTGSLLVHYETDQGAKKALLMA